jgi:methyl-accepting chemotaxis protein
LARSLGKLVTELGGASERLVEVSSQISNASTHLSEGASTQAASIEEVSSSLEEMAAMTRSNAEGAREASGLANNATAAAKDGDQAIVQLNDAMAKINDSSTQIRAIVKLIQDIAFQTNLLALNAAVEAARAGDAGKGFAVVADEVRNLARKASEATGDITRLIEEAVNRSKEGTRVSTTVGKVFQGISTDVHKVSELIGKIASASQEQAQGAEQVNLSVSQLDKVTQENASQAEESAAASEELNSQAHTLGGMVDGLTELVGGAGAKAA